MLVVTSMSGGKAWPPGRTARIGTWSRPGRPRANRAGSGGAAALNCRVSPPGEPLGAESTGRVPVGSRRLHDRVGDAVRRPGPLGAARDPGRCHGRRGHTGPCRPRQRPRRRREVARAQKTRPHRWRWNARERATGPWLAWAGVGSRPPDRAGSLAWPPGMARSRARSPGRGLPRCVPPSHWSCATPRPRAVSATLVSFEAVRRLLRPDHQLAVSIAHAFGWRMQSEVLTLERRQVGLEAGTLRLEPGTTKNDDGRVVYLTPGLKALIGTQLERVRSLERETGQIIPYLFPHLRGPHRGKRLQDLKKVWKTACVKAGCPGMLRHDFRRTAVRNMVNLGVPERVAIKVSGHRSQTAFDRYHIVSPGDLQEVARKLTGTISGTTPQNPPDSLPVNI